jgi:ankyrin repeat protein
VKDNLVFDEDIESINTDCQFYEILKSLNLDEMKKHIINCIASLIHVTEKVKEMNENDKLNEKKKEIDVIISKNKVFSAAVAMIGQALVSRSFEISNILEAFPNNLDIDWNPLAWAVSLGLNENNEVKEEDIKRLYLADPFALKRHHHSNIENDRHLTGYSPAHMLCMQTKPSLPLIKFLMGHNPMAFSERCSNKNQYLADFPIHTLHLAAKHSESVELLQILLQLDKSVTKMKAAFSYEVLHTPLEMLCERTESAVVMDMILCLIEVDSSVEVIEGAICSCLSSGSIEQMSSTQPGSIGHYKLTLITMLLNANLEAARCENEDLIHCICQHTRGDLFMSLMSLFLTINEDALQIADTDGNLPIILAAQYHNLAAIEYFLSIYPESVSMENNDGELPIHIAAQHNTLAVIRRLLNIYPASATTTDSDGLNILHSAMFRNDKDAEIVRFIFTQYPGLIHERNNYGYTPLLLALSCSSFKGASAICQVNEQVIRDVVIDTETSHYTHLFNPLHIMIGNSLEFEPVSELADCFRLLIKLHPEAAGIRNDRGSNPYDYALSQQRSSYMLRLLLRADPTINPNELHKINYAERRQAMFLAFRAIVSSSEVSIWRRLRMENENLLRHVVSFL